MIIDFVDKMNALIKTSYRFPNQTAVYNGKVRDVYTIGGKELVMITTDRISAFDVVMPRGIPFKGQILNQIAAKFLDETNLAFCSAFASPCYCGNKILSR